MINEEDEDDDDVGEMVGNRHRPVFAYQLCSWPEVQGCPLAPFYIAWESAPKEE